MMRIYEHWHNNRRLIDFIIDMDKTLISHRLESLGSGLQQVHYFYYFW